MQVTEGAPGNRQFIESYGPGRFIVSGIEYSGSVLIYPDRTETWHIAEFENLSLDDLRTAIDDPGVEFLLLGCGSKIAFPSKEIRDGARAAGKSIEPMDTGAACRTFNVLSLEERRVAAALIAI